MSVDLDWSSWSNACSTHVVVLPLAGIEPHGLHLPVSTDLVIVEELARRAASRASALVLPTIAYGVREYDGRLGGRLPGAIALKPESYLAILRDVFAELAREGASTVLALHAGYANVAMCEQVAIEAAESRNGMRIVNAAWWDFVSESTRDRIAGETGVPRDRDHHAAVVETSVMMYFRPDLVKADALRADKAPNRPRFTLHPLPDQFATDSGVVYDATAASESIGEQIVDECVSGLVELLLGTEEMW